VEGGGKKRNLSNKGKEGGVDYYCEPGGKEDGVDCCCEPGSEKKVLKKQLKLLNSAIIIKVRITAS